MSRLEMPSTTVDDLQAIATLSRRNLAEVANEFVQAGFNAIKTYQLPTLNGAAK